MHQLTAYSAVSLIAFKNWTDLVFINEAFFTHVGGYSFKKSDVGFRRVDKCLLFISMKSGTILFKINKKVKMTIKYQLKKGK